MKSKRLPWVVVGLLVMTGISGVVTAIILGPPSTSTISFLQIDLSPSGFPTKVTPGGTYYFNITARSTYATDTTGVFIVVTINKTCAQLASSGFVLAGKSALYGGYAPLTGADASGSCTFMNVGIQATVPTGRVPVVYWFRQTFTSALPDLTWAFQAARQN